MTDFDDEGLDETQVVSEVEPNDEMESVGVARRGRAVRLFGHDVPALAVGVVAGALVLGLGAGVICLASQSSVPVDADAASAAATSDEASAAAFAGEEQVLDLGVTADGWDATASSPVIVHVESEDGSVDFYHAYGANERAGIAVGAEGTYKVSFVSPVNADGSIYRVGDTSEVQTVAEDEFDSVAGGVESDLPFTFEKVEADAVTEEELTNIAKDVAEAVKKGDETLTGENGTNVVSKVDENIKKNPSANADAVTEETTKAEETAKNEESTAKKSDKSDSSGSSKKSDSGSDSQTSRGVSSSSTTGGSSQTARGESATHQHDWVAQTRVVHHDAVTHQETYTVHHDAVTHQVWHDAVREYASICNGCGANITGREHEHCKAALQAGNTACGAYTNTYVTVTDGYYETVVDSAAWDETKSRTVTDSGAWDETVVSGYVCNGCGATKS